MRIKKLNEEIKKVLKEWMEFSNTFAINLYVDEEYMPKVIKLAKKYSDIHELESVLRGKNISFAYSVTIDEDSFEAESLDELQQDIEEYYSDYYSTVDTSLNVYGQLEITDDDEIEVADIDVSLFDDEGEHDDDDEYDDDEDDDDEY